MLQILMRTLGQQQAHRRLKIACYVLYATEPEPLRKAVAKPKHGDATWSLMPHIKHVKRDFQQIVLTKCTVELNKIFSVSNLK